MDETLQQTLRTLLRSGTESNSALNRLIDDYTRYHVVLVIVGGLFLLGLILLSLVFWRRFSQAPRKGPRRWSFEKKTYFCFGIVSVMVGLLLALIVAANVSTALNPRQGFSGSVPMLATPAAGTQTDALYRDVNAWLQSGNAETPAVVQDRINDRLAWQRPKAIVCTVLLIVLLACCALVWRALIRRSRDPAARWRLQEVALLMLGVVMVLCCLLLMLMVMGNTQASIAPISLTLFFS